MKHPLPCLVVLLWSGAVPLLAAGLAADDDIAARMNRLESETQALREELQWLREHPVRLPSVEATAVSTGVEPAAGQAGQEGSFTVLDLQAEMKKLAWTKGDFKVVPYGSLWGSAIYETERSFPGPYTLYVFSVDEEGDHSFVVDTRRTRLGFDVIGPKIPLFRNAESGGRVEIDFHGAFMVENKPGTLLRHAYGEIKNEDFRLLAGQTYDVISPLNPGTLSYSVGWCGGNIGYRRAQVRLERYLPSSDRLLWTVQGSINQNIISDLSTAPGVRPESSDWPLMEGRVAATLGERGPGARPITFGVSGHIGEQGFDFLTTGPPPLNLPPRNDARLRTWSLNADLYVPITERFGVQGEFFTGENLSTFLGGINQGVALETRNTIRASGGWFDVWYDWTPRLHSRSGYGLDDPFDQDLLTGRSYNQYIYANTSFDVTKQLNIGLEVSSWKTLYLEKRPGQRQLRPGESVGFEFTGKYGY
jgi:hypothetical protein